MSPSLIFGAVLVLAAAGYVAGRQRALAVVDGDSRRLHSLPGYHGLSVAMAAALPALALALVWMMVEPQVARAVLERHLPPRVQQLDAGMRELVISDTVSRARGQRFGGEAQPDLEPAIQAYAEVRSRGAAAMAGAVLVVALLGMLWSSRRVAPDLRARNDVERIVTWVMLAASTVAVLTTIGIVLSLVFEAWRFFEKVAPAEFFFGLRWSPQTALRADQVGSSGAFGAIPLFAGTLLITSIAMAVAVPIGLFSAVYMSEYASPRARALVKPALEVLAGVPTVVYGFFAALTVAPFLREVGTGLGLDVASESALAAGGVMGVMIIPFVSSLSDDVMNAVPQTLRDGSYALGATKSETIREVVLPAALPGIVGSVLLAISRAIGETMIVVMAAGLAANLTINPLEAVTTVTVQIVTLLVGDQEFDSAKTLAAFALGLVLFVLTLALNIVALRVVRRYREKYD